MNINNLPDLVFRVIFGKVPLLDLLHVGRVCKLWRKYQQEIVGKVDSLTLLIGNETERGYTPLDLITSSWFKMQHLDELVGEDGQPLFVPPFGPAWSHLAYANLDLATVELLVEELPNVNSLIIAINDMECSIIDHVTRLLNHWMDKVITLKLYCRFLSDPNMLVIARQLIPLFQCINSMLSLENLTIDFKEVFLFGENRELLNELDITFLTRMRNFTSVLKMIGSLSFY